MVVVCGKRYRAATYGDGSAGFSEDQSANALAVLRPSMPTAEASTWWIAAW